MAAIRNIVGHCRFEFAKAARTCDVSKSHQIQPNDRHFAYEEIPGIRKNICMKCAPGVLSTAQAHLAGLIGQL